MVIALDKGTIFFFFGAINMLNVLFSRESTDDIFA